MQLNQQRSEPTVRRLQRKLRPAKQCAECALLSQEPDDTSQDLCEQLVSAETMCLDCDLLASKGLALLDASGMTSAPALDVVRWLAPRLPD